MMDNNSTQDKSKVNLLSIANMIHQGVLCREIDQAGAKILSNFLKENDLNTSIKLLTSYLVSSREFNIANTPKVIVNIQFDGIKKTDFKKNRTDEVLILQTSDAEKYIPIINASSKFNMQYCESKGIKYQQFIGLKRGTSPHHAMFNRIYLLKELLDEGFSGWVLYLDADAIIVNTEVDIKKHFSNLRENGRSMQLHLVENDASQYWNVNTGVFAIDLSTKFSSRLIYSWYLFYELLYQEKQFEEANFFWDEIVNDQNSLHMILMSLGEKTVNEFFLLDQFLQKNLCTQFTRSGATITPSEESILIRADQILKLGGEKYQI